MLNLTGFDGNECYQCGVCTAMCPIGYMGEESLDVRNLMRRAQIGLEINDKIWNCSTCKLCEQYCPRQVNIVHVITGLRQMEFEDHHAPDKVEKLLWDIYENGNPWGGKKNERAKWAEGLDIKDAKNGTKVLLFVGCDAAYNKRMHNSLVSLAKVLKKANVDFGILGNEEKCCGEPIKNAGETAYLEDIVQENISQFEKTNAETIVAFSPHCENMFKTVYKEKGLNKQVVHYSIYLNNLLKEGRIDLKEGAKGKITIHDPCYISRYGGNTKDLREMFHYFPGIELTEMQANGENSLCCGGGGNRMFFDFQGKRLSDFRIEQASETGAETVLTACPTCNMNLEDSRKVKGIKLEVKEISEYLEEMIK